jgi:hypothetical protein
VSTEVAGIDEVVCFCTAQVSSTHNMAFDCPKSRRPSCVGKTAFALAVRSIHVVRPYKSLTLFTRVQYIKNRHESQSD